jgi:hypothetical protein
MFWNNLVMKKCIIKNSGTEAHISESKCSAYSVMNIDEETNEKLVVVQEQTGLD